MLIRRKKINLVFDLFLNCACTCKLEPPVGSLPDPWGSWFKQSLIHFISRSLIIITAGYSFLDKNIFKTNNLFPFLIMYILGREYMALHLNTLQSTLHKYNLCKVWLKVTQCENFRWMNTQYKHQPKCDQKAHMSYKFI